jgi:uncharacterized nucleotidyltransferase DUF6036
MTPPRSPRFLAAVELVQGALDACEVPAMLIGGVAVIAHGVPRTTLDVDATIEGALADLDALVEAWGQLGLAPRVEGALEFARRHQTLLLNDERHDVPVDVTLAWLPFEAEAIARSELVRLGDLRVRVPRVEDLLVYKLIARRPKDLDDAERLLLLYRDRVVASRLRGAVAEFAEVLEDEGPLRELERLLARAGVDGR